MEKYTDLGFAKPDYDRISRKGTSEAVFCECKTNEQLIKIFKSFAEAGQNALGTRATSEQYEALKKEFKEIKYNKAARTLVFSQKETEKIGKIAVCTGGTGDIPVAEEAAETAEFYGSNVEKYYDIGIAGIHRLFDKIDDIRKANVIITVAGMEGALGGIIAGLVDVPLITVPTSIGYGASFHGLSALLTMLNSCAEGITVVNIDNGFGAGYSASRINRLIAGVERKV